MLFSRKKFKVPFEPSGVTIAELLHRAWPGATEEQIRRSIEALEVRADDRIVRRADETLAPETLVEVEVEPGEEVFGLPEGDALAWGPGWVVANKPTGMGGWPDRDDPMDGVLFLADMLGIDRDSFEPVWAVPAVSSGPWLLGLTHDAAEALRQAHKNGSLMTTWVALVPRVAVPRGRFKTPGGSPVEYSMIRAQGGICEIQLIPNFGGSDEAASTHLVDVLLDTLASAGYPALGDAERGGYMIEGGLRLRVSALLEDTAELGHSWSTPPDWWPSVPVVGVEEKETGPMAEANQEAREIPWLQVSRQTLEIMREKGHPWVLRDQKTGGVDHLKPGALVRLRSPEGEHGPFALVEGSDELVARFWGREEEDVASFVDEVEMRVDEAIARRAALLKDMLHTNVFRLIHGEADGLPGLLVDRLGPVVRATLRGRTSFAFKDIVYANLLRHEPDMMLLEAQHLQDVRESELPRAQVVHAGGRYVREGERLTVLEDGLRYLVEPWEGIDVGFFADQRDNRRKLVARARPGQGWLNLFCHTGAFSVALAHAGARVVSVDLSRRYLTWLEENLAINGIDPALNESAEADCRDYLKSCRERFDGIIVDPPTAAAGTRTFWSVRREYEQLLVDCFDLLAPQGVMLVCRNDRKRSQSLESLVRRAAEGAGKKVRRVAQAGPATDYPTMKGFVEGETFEGLIVEIA
jgi:23S rRNA (cytosine1962-C5)-methyltransferase